MMPSPNGRNGRGQFAKGNPGGPGNPHARRIGRLRSTLLRTITPEDIQAVVQKLIARAKCGDMTAISLLFDRIFGRPGQALEVSADITTAVERPTEIPIDDPLYIEFCSWLLAKGKGNEPLRVVDGFNVDFADFLREQAIITDSSKGTGSTAVVVRHVDDWYGSKAANQAATDHSPHSP